MKDKITQVGNGYWKMFKDNVKFMGWIMTFTLVAFIYLQTNFVSISRADAIDGKVTEVEVQLLVTSLTSLEFRLEHRINELEKRNDETAFEELEKKIKKLAKTSRKLEKYEDILLDMKFKGDK